MLASIRPHFCFAAPRAHLKITAAIAIASTAALTSPASAQPQDDGVWSPVRGWPLIAVHAALAPDGRVLTYGTDGAGKQTGYFIYDSWDPQAGLSAGHTTFSNMTLTDIFCSSQVIMPQSGDILIAGGDNWTGTGTTNTGNNNSNVFNPISRTLVRANNMNRARWYSSSTVLVNGDVYIQGGNGGKDFPEVRQQNGTFRLLTSASTNLYEATFPRNFISPDGRVFGYDTSGRMYYVNPAGTGSVSVISGQLPSANVGGTSGAAMFRPGKILQVGGNSNGAIVIDLNRPLPKITATQSMSTQRQWVSATVIADGKVLATGGSAVANEMTGVAYKAEIWDPDLGEWHLGAPAVKARLYHSSALLLQDATVLIAGGGAPGPQTNTNAEIYYPPYLFDDTGAYAVRPRIVSAPSETDVGSTLPLEVEGDVARVTLVKTGSVTHSVNMDQRFIELPLTGSGSSRWAQLPPRASDTPPGYYHVFAIDSAGVPSVSSMLRINIDSTPNTAVDYTPTIGGTGGTAFELACLLDEVLVGIHGRYATSVNQVGPQCVRADQFGHWIGDPVARPVTGATTTGTAFNKLCPRDAAVSGFRGLSSTSVNQIELQCRALTPSGGLTGVGTFLGPSGGTGGTAQPLQTCGTENPVYAFYGRSGSVVDSFGVMCRPGAITPISTNSIPVVVNPGTQAWIVGAAVNLAVTASDSDVGDTLTFGASGLPAGLQINSASGVISGAPIAAGTGQAIVTANDGHQSGLAAFTWSVAATAPLAVQPMPSQPSRLSGIAITYTATATGGVNVRYKWQFGDGSAQTAYASSPSVVHTFASPGIYFVTLTVTDDVGPPAIQQFAQTVHLPLTALAGRNSATLAYEQRTGANSRVWVVNQDNDSVGVLDAVTKARLAEIMVGAGPRSVAIAPDGRIWVVGNKSASISIVNPSTLAVAQTVILPFGSQPYGIVFSPTANQAFVVLAGTGALLKLDGSTGAQLGMIATGANPRHVAIDGAGATLYVSRFVTPLQPGEETAVVATQAGTGGEVLAIDANSMSLQTTIVLRHSDKVDAENQGGGVPNYLGAVAISPDGATATVPSKQDNIARGTLRIDATHNLNFQNTVRAVSSRIDLATRTENYARRIDHDNSSVASAAVYDRYGIYLFVALETSRQVAVIDAHAGAELFRIDVGRAPQAVVLSPDSRTLYVNNFMDRTVDVFDLSELQDKGQWAAPRIATITARVTERLAANVLAGKQLFYDARDPRLARDSYMSCASCHNDGGQDGRVWDLTGMGEGLRNTISLRGPAAAHGRLHWTQNFDEVQDFEGQIRSLAGGTGLMSDAAFTTGTRNQSLGDPKAGLSADLDALAAYVASLNEFASSPYRTSTGALTAEGAAGKVVFKNNDCAACHGGTAFTNSSTNVLQNIGTLKPTSGKRLGGALTGLDPPTLRSVWQTGPYLHDGSAPTIAAAITAHSGVALSASNLSALAAYVAQIDPAETTAPVNAAPTLQNPGDQTGILGKAVSLQIAASDADGDVLTYGASGLPAGLSINTTTGRITGTPTAVTAPNVAVSASDGRVTVSMTFRFTILADSSPPTKPGKPSITLVSGKPSLSWAASTDNVGVTGYIIYRAMKNSQQETEVGRTTSTTFRDATATSRTWYYSIRAYDAANNLSGQSPSTNVAVP